MSFRIIYSPKPALQQRKGAGQFSLGVLPQGILCNILQLLCAVLNFRFWVQVAPNLVCVEANRPCECLILAEPGCTYQTVQMQAGFALPLVLKWNTAVYTLFAWWILHDCTVRCFWWFSPNWIEASTIDNRVFTDMYGTWNIVYLFLWWNQSFVRVRVLQSCWNLTGPTVWAGAWYQNNISSYQSHIQNLQDLRLVEWGACGVGVRQEINSNSIREKTDRPTDQLWWVVRHLYHA